MPLPFATRAAGALALAAFATAPAATPPQFDQIPVPEAMGALEFMVGDWTVEGAFRTPDYVGEDRTLWYLVRGGGVTRFDGRSWAAFAPGASSESDAVLQQIDRRGDPFGFTTPRTVTRIQDGFALLIDDGRTSGSVVVFFDTARERWVATQIHAPSNAITSSEGVVGDVPIFEGEATDRRGRRIFRTRYERHDANHYSTHTDVSFDDGVTWIDDQVVQQVRRR